MKNHSRIKSTFLSPFYMKKHITVLRKLSKFFSGIIVADFLVGVWLYFGNLLPMKFLGINISPEIAILGMIFDLLLLCILIHYAWNISLPSSMRQKNWLWGIGILLGVVSLLHLLRLIFNIDITIGVWELPFWLSWAGTIITAYLSYVSFQFASHK